MNQCCFLLQNPFTPFLQTLTPDSSTKAAGPERATHLYGCRLHCVSRNSFLKLQQSSQQSASQLGGALQATTQLRGVARRSSVAVWGPRQARTSRNRLLCEHQGLKSQPTHLTICKSVGQIRQMHASRGVLYALPDAQSEGAAQEGHLHSSRVGINSIARVQQAVCFQFSSRTRLLLAQRPDEQTCAVRNNHS